MPKRESVIILIAFFGAAVYLVAAWSRGVVGFPLDDAWIHQVYARNLATRGEFAFFAGQPSAGSTSPLWAVLLSIGYLLRIDFRLWAYFLGAVFLSLAGIFGASLSRRLSLSRRTALCFLFFALLEWHLAWSAVSGMEISLFVFLSLALVERLFARERSWVLGLLAGLLVLTRPEGIVLAGLIAVGMIADAGQGDGEGVALGTGRWSKWIRMLALYASGFAVLVLPYLAFNLWTSGTLFPNTFYAKSAEYAVLIERAPFILRWAQLLAVPWIGAQILLLPGFVFMLARLAVRRDYRALVPALWVLALPALYALRLPVAYQHGRYEIPVVPFVLLYGIWGTVELAARIKSSILRATWAVSIAVTLLAFWVMGANAYSTDVAIIDCEMVQTAQWVAANTPRGGLVAAHDIGALGYYYDQPFIDLAGLVSPEVIPIIRDESRLRDFLYSRQTAFVIAFPDWYDSLTSDPLWRPIYQRDCLITRVAGGTDMVVYAIPVTGQ